jgi:hypothetical protein
MTRPAKPPAPRSNELLLVVYKTNIYGNGIVTSVVKYFRINAEVHAMDEHRIVPRRRQLKGGKISFGNGAAIDCTIRNLSESGAALEVDSPVGIPERFMLVVEADHRHLPSRVIWRKEARIGVHFEN